MKNLLPGDVRADFDDGVGYARRSPEVRRTGYVDKAIFLGMVREKPRKVGKDIEVHWFEKDKS